MGDGGGGGDKVDQAHVLFDRFVQGTTFKGTLKAFQELCDYLELKSSDYRIFYHKLKSKLNYWKAKALWAKLDKRASHKDYKKGRACANSKCLIIGAGPCGLRTAIELCFLGAKVVILEKRDAFSRNNVLHLWPFTIQDLRGLGAKKFYGKFCAGSIDHISIRQLQLMLLKMALLLGVEIHVNIEFCGLIEPPEDQENERIGWRAEVRPRTHPVSELEFDVIIGADGKRNTLPGFRRKEFRGKLAIAITANFINRNTSAEAKVEEISGVAFIFNQKFFQDLREATGVDLENIVYYKDDTHYFVMTAKKQSLLEKGVILHDYADTEMLLSRENVDQEALLNYACEAADFSTNHQLPKLDFAINHYGQPDVAMFDFTCMYASENAALMRERNGHPLLVALVGDSLLEPFWPMGTGIARGFLAAMDSAWMVRSWAQGNSPLEVLAERESIYRLLPQTTPENVSKNFSQYSVNPTTRYPNISLHFLRPNQVRHLVDTGDSRDTRVEMENAVNSRTPKLMRNESVARSNKLLNWCQRQTEGFRNVNVTDLTMSWKSGLALCALIHRYRPDLIDFDSLEEQNMEKNNQLAFDVAEREFGISPIMTGKEMTSVGEPDKLSMVMYLTQFYEMFKDTLPPGDNYNLSLEDKAALISNTKSPISFLSKLGQSISRKRNPKDKKEKEVEVTGKRRKTSQSEDEDPPRGYRDERAALVCALSERKIETGIGNQNKVKSMATQLLAKFEENAPAQSSGLKRQRALLPYQERLLTPPTVRQKEQGRLAPVPLWRQATSVKRSRSCPKKIILLSSSSSSSSSSLSVRAQQGESEGSESEGPVRERMPPIVYSDDQVPIFTPSIEERASQITTHFEQKPDRRQRYIKMYTGGVSSLAEQITNQLQKKDQPKPFLDKKALGSFRREFPQNIGGSDVCFFCRKRVYVMERLSAEGKFFHRSCFKCDYCNTTLRLSSYAFDVEDGKFYCKPHYCYRLSGYAQRKRPAEVPLTAKENKVSLPDPVAADGPVRANATATPTERTPAVDVNGVEEPGLAKRLRGTPERIELENYRLSLQREEELEEVPEETLAEHNLSSVLDKGTDEGEGSSSSESEMDEVEEEGEDEDHPVSDLGGVPWKQAVHFHARLKGKSETQIAAEEEACALGEEKEEDEDEDEDDEEDDDDDDEEEKEEEEESSEEGEYYPWERELQLGLWLEHLKDEEDTGRFKAGNLRIQQVLQPVDPLEIQADVHWTHICSEQEKEGAPTSQPSPSTAPCEENELEVGDESGIREEEPEVGTELDEDDIPSDAEAEAQMHRIERKEQPPDEEGESDGRGRVSSIAQSSVSSVRSLSDVLLSPVTSMKDQEVEGVCETLSPASLLKSPGARFFQEPYLPKEGKEDIISETPEAKTLISPTLPFSPVRFQPLPLAEAVIPKSPVKMRPSASPPATSPVCAHSPVCSQPLPSTEPSSPVMSRSPVRTQPVPAFASTPLVKPIVESETLEKQNSLSPSADDPVKKTDIIEEFWMKSAEIRKSLGLTPLDRSKGSENSFPESTPESSPPRSDTPEELSEEQKLYPNRPQPALRRLNIATIDGHQLSNLIIESPSEKKLKSSDTEKKDVGSSSGLGLNGSMANTQKLTSESFNTSESTMLTPPSSPPPPPPENEEPATLRRNKYQASWSTVPEPTPVPAPVPQKAPAAAPTPAPSPVPPQTRSEFRQEPSRKSREEVRKSFVESVDEIPFADDVEDTYDDRTPDTSFQEKFYTPPTSKPKQEKPLFHMALAMENGKLNLGEGATTKRQQAMPAISPEAKEIAEERMRAREKSVKSQALKDAMARQLTKMKEVEAVKGGGSAKAVWNVESSRPKVSSLVSKSNIPSAVKSLESKKHEKTADKFLSPLGGQSLEGSVASSEGSTGGKSKKRTSLFSPRKNKKEKKPKSEGRLSDKHNSEEAAKPKSLWKTVFSGYKKDKKKKEDKSCPSTPSSVTTVDSGKKGASPVIRATGELHLRRHLSFSEDSDLSCDDVLERSSQKSKIDQIHDIFDLVSDMQRKKEESVYVPHALAFKRSYASKKTYTEEELNAKITRRVQKAARRQAKQEELKRLHRAQIIQRQLEQVEEKQRQLEERGVAVEKALRGEADYWGESNYSEIIDLHLGVEPNVGTPRRRPISFCHCCTHEGMGKKDDPKLMQEWFKLVQEKNALVRYESELMIFARELELEDRQSRLQQELRERMAVDDHLKMEEELAEEKRILNEMLEVVEQRDSLVALLEEQRLSEREEDKDLEEVMLSKGFNLNWS
ncbi:protein-methionine sulfoxide oxidase mical3a isoform X7 [Acipenser ruthenus]|uniref:protein-methionine sulfoxide oxidase mical3a isoform X7 n=1 Tax=Acipenser ruthenus TaxID=7906 RepID=UPI0027405053|nr:protein-methionine sulfoxide oxidase mical3a isoform X7 [Acipenser ruthenus]